MENDPRRFGYSLKAHRKPANSVCVLTYAREAVTGWADTVLHGRQLFQWIAL